MNPNVRTSDPETSQAAATRAPATRERDRERVLETLRAHPDGLTDFELAALLGRQQTSVGKRRGELRDDGLVQATNQRRPSPSGSPAIVWEAVSQEQLRREAKERAARREQLRREAEELDAARRKAAAGGRLF